MFSTKQPADFAPIPPHRPDDARDEAMPSVRSLPRPLGVRSASRER
jgi:hypothetical protein